MSTDPNEVTQTIPQRGPAGRETRTGALVVIGDGASLEVLRAGRLVPMTERVLDIGRRPPPATDRDLLTLSDGTVSGLHARLQRAEDRPDLFVLQDLGSTNGTFVDGPSHPGADAAADGAAAVPRIAGAGLPARSRRSR